MVATQDLKSCALVAYRFESGSPYQMKTTNQNYPWSLEPDCEEFVYKGFLCTVKRGPLGAFCGYVGVCEDHKLYGVDHDNEIFNSIDVHGGLTYSDGHTLWQFGFDCAHLYDVVPSMLTIRPDESTYKDIYFVTNEVKKLADQLYKL